MDTSQQHENCLTFLCFCYFFSCPLLCCQQLLNPLGLTCHFEGIRILNKNWMNIWSNFLITQWKNLKLDDNDKNNTHKTPPQNFLFPYHCTCAPSQKRHLQQYADRFFEFRFGNTAFEFLQKYFKTNTWKPTLEHLPQESGKKCKTFSTRVPFPWCTLN